VIGGRMPELDGASLRLTPESSSKVKGTTSALLTVARAVRCDCRGSDG